MKTLVAAALLTLAMPQNETLPTVHHDKRDYHPPVQTFDTVTRTCPEGYEGHFVDPQVGINDSDTALPLSPLSLGSSFSGGSQPAFAICLRKDFMDQVRAHPDLKVTRSVPRPM